MQPYPKNVSGAVLAISSNDATIKMFEVSNGKVEIIFIYIKIYVHLNVT